VTGVRDMEAALERGRNIVVVVPPAPEQAVAVWPLLGPGSVIVCTDPQAAADWVAATPSSGDRRVHPVTGLVRTSRLLKDGGIDLLAGALKDLTALVSRSALKLDAVTTLVLAWPEALVAGDQAAALDTLLSEAGNARRIILTWNPGLLTDFLDRQAHRAPVFGDLPVGEDARPLHPVGPARYAVVPVERRLAAIREVLDVLNPGRAFVWSPDPTHVERLRALLGTSNAEVAIDSTPQGAGFDAVICARVPSRTEFAALSKLTSSEPVLLVSGAQLPYLRSIANLRPLPLPAAGDRARDRAEVLRAEVAARIEGEDLDGELALLDPLFARFDAAEVAAALLAMSRSLGAGSVERSAPVPSAAPSWIKVFINIGKKDKVAAKDLVGALTREVKVDKSVIGRIDVRDTFSVLDIAPAAVEIVIRGLSTVTVKGRRVSARRDRQG
jgi:ATP-dependent RNA helicase DeaD